MLVPSPKWLDTGNNAWQLAAATFVGLQSIPGLVVLYGGVVKTKWAINSAFMAMYAFASVLIVWILFDYNMAFGPTWLSLMGNDFLGTPMPAASAAFSLGQATIPAAASGMPDLTFPMATLVFFQFVFAAITVIILAGSVLGRMSFKAWVIFCPVWIDVYKRQEHRSACIGVSEVRIAAVEAVPSQPKDAGTDEGGQQAVGWEVIAIHFQARSDHRRSDEAGCAGGKMDDVAAREVSDTQASEPTTTP